MRGGMRARDLLGTVLGGTVGCIVLDRSVQLETVTLGLSRRRGIKARRGNGDRTSILAT